eukprot:CAMPEP_0174717400 /NCGR_PEP_ID=MMETSP1094-20130205/26411_1 /TAXON_ID=156173 /ORGANISM="Chrysochromulina brevifilum, Strain UTEX LB 985" /LENGTH=35 /DNA_ID= /DNA_START= /DNA_END= /DNA_ORIENTATION=
MTIGAVRAGKTFDVATIVVTATRSSHLTPLPITLM